MAAVNPSYRQWKNVYVTHFSEDQELLGIAMKGTLFLTEHGSEVRIHWVPDPDQDNSLAPEFTKGYEINVAELEHFTARMLPGFRYRALHLYLKDSSWYGPFEFRTGGASDFINTLEEVVDVKRSPNDKTLYEIRLRKPLYQLPASSTTGSISQRFGGGISAFVEVGTSLHRAQKMVKNAILDSILAPSSSSLATVVGVQTPFNGVYAASQADPSEAGVDVNRLQTTKEDAGFQVIDVRPPQIALPPMPRIRRAEPLTMEQWRRHLDPFGRVTCVEKLRKTIFEGGVESNMRSTVWKYLLGYFLWDNTSEENEKRRLEKHCEYRMLKTFWKDMSVDRLVRSSLLRDRKSYIDKDVPRTDRKSSFFRDDAAGNLTKLYDILMTYTVYNMDMGYYQGMNDLLALVLYVIQQEEDAFWCFAGLMERFESNFDGNLDAVREQFYQLFELVEVFDPAFSEYLDNQNAREMLFCFRWLLIQFKREFSYKDVMVLWETIWSEHLTKNFHIFFAAAILISQRNIIMSRNYDAIHILKHVNDLSFNIPLETILVTATGYIKQLDSALGKVQKSVRNILEGVSLATNKHAINKANTDSTDNSPRLDHNWGLLNEEIEDLMTSDAQKETSEPPTGYFSISGDQMLPSSSSIAGAAMDAFTHKVPLPQPPPDSNSLLLESTAVIVKQPM